MPERELHQPFHHRDRQREADRLGMLIFLASEAMLFGAILTAAMALRLMHPQEYGAAAAHLKLGLGTANTAILLTSSLMAALAVVAAREGRARGAGAALAAAMLLGIVFLGVKGWEYLGEYREGLVPGIAGSGFDGRFQQLFMNLYFIATGLHALHLVIGLVLLGVAAGRSDARHDRGAVLIGNAALYWHLVDIVWVFLYPTLYLAGVA